MSHASADQVKNINDVAVLYRKTISKPMNIKSNKAPSQKYFLDLKM